MAPEQSPMRRILVIGSPGAGKSTLALRLGEQLNVPVIHLDRLHWKPGWVSTNREELREKITAATTGETWIMDGNYGGTMEMRLELCDTVIFFDLPRHTCVLNALKRNLTSRNRPRPDITEGCREKLNWEFVQFLWWIWRFPRHTRPVVLDRLRRFEGTRHVITLHSRREAASWLEALESEQNDINRHVPRPTLKGLQP